MSAESGFDKVNPWPEHHSDMHICPDPHCGAEMMYPMDWELFDDHSGWIVELYCGECQSFFQGIFQWEQVESFKAINKINAENIRNDIALLEHQDMEQMEQYVRLFEGALQAGQIYPMDFR